MRTSKFLSLLVIGAVGAIVTGCGTRNNVEGVYSGPNNVVVQNSGIGSPAAPHDVSLTISGAGGNKVLGNLATTSVPTPQTTNAVNNGVFQQYVTSSAAMSGTTDKNTFNIQDATVQVRSNGMDCTGKASGVLTRTNDKQARMTGNLVANTNCGSVTMQLNLTEVEVKN